jgi:O-antigen biosynthesis protein
MAGQQKTATIVPRLSVPDLSGRPLAKGRFLFAGDDKISVRGVTYGPFGPAGSDFEYHDKSCVQKDFERMAISGINAVRTYTVPPPWLLDLAMEYRLRVMVGVPWEQHVTFLDDPGFARRIVDKARSSIRACSGHPAILCYAIGNEIPSSIVRWHGARCIEQFLLRLYQVTKVEDPTALFTYVNYPCTEYLQLPFLDLVAFNVYLHSTESLTAYISRLLNLAGDRPLLIAEVGVDSRRHGLSAQSRMLEQQIQTIMHAGCIGTFVFAWTDEWHRGGSPIDDWDFGLTARNRTAKPALVAVANAFATEPSPGRSRWPKISVILCSYNGQRYIAETLDALEALDYPDYETVVVDDGSTDATPDIAARYPVRLVRTDNCGLSSARNTGLAAATGEIVAYIDDDAYPERDWLKRLAMAFQDGEFVGMGGPNIPPPDDPLIAQCVAHAPGGPTHVLLSDREAEHIPGCNMAFRRSSLLEIGGFDPQFRAAGDDVDICWRLQQQGWKLGFAPTATVFHHRRATLRAYWKQQLGYGKAEALLERKWPNKYNAAGHLTWAGRIYSPKGLTQTCWWRRGRIYQGMWGSAAYQRLYQAEAHLLSDLPLLPEWYLVIAFLATLSATGLIWHPLLMAIPLLVIAAGASLFESVAHAAAASSFTPQRRGFIRVQVLGLSIVLHLMQPLARLLGRVQCGLHPWRHRGAATRSLPRLKTFSIWTEACQTAETWLSDIQTRLRSLDTCTAPGGEYDDWDLEIPGGMLARVRLRMAVEEHGAGRQMLRFRVWPRYSLSGSLAFILMTCISAAAAYDRAWPAVAFLFIISAILGMRMWYEGALAMNKVTNILTDFRSFAEQETGTRPNTKPVALRAIGRKSSP